MRATEEALYIRVNSPSLKRNIGKYYQPHIWDEILLNISELKLNKTIDPWLYHLPCGNNINHLTITHPTVAIPSATWQ